MAYDEETFKHIRQGGMKTSAAETLATVVYDYENGGLGGTSGAFQSEIVLFGPEPRTTAALTQTNTGGYLWPGQALSASTCKVRFSNPMRTAVFVRWLLVWIPNATDNGMRLVHADDGPANITQIAEFTGLSTGTPIVSESDITAVFNALVTAGVDKQLGNQITAGGTGPSIYLSRIEIVWE